MDVPVRILIAEDDPADAELVLRELREAGLQCEARRVDGEREFELALREHDPQLVISDLQMGAFDGGKALRLTRQARPGVPVLIVTGSSSEQAVVDCMRAGAADFVAKERLGRLVPAARAALEAARLRDHGRHHDERLRQLIRAVEQSPALIVITDVEGRIEYVNPQFEWTTGYLAGEVIGQNPRLLKSGLAPASLYESMWATITAGETWHGELQNRTKDGRIYWERTSISGVRDPSGRVSHYVKVAEDVTESRRAEELLRVTEQQLLQAQKMEAIGRLAGGIAHDFNNLLSVILGQAEQLAQREDSDCRERARQIVWTAEKAASLTRQLLAFSRRQVLEPRVVRLDTIASDARDMLQRVIGEDVELEVVRRETLGSVKADPDQLVQVLLNLAVNARDAMPQGGRLTVEFENMLLDERYVASHPPCKPGPYVMMAVTDTGLGIDPDIQRRIFEPFFTTKPEGAGTGLGLSTVYGIIKQSGGFIWVYSELNVGTCFKIYLPRTEVAASTPPEAVAPRASVPAAGARARSRILLVEDDEGVRELMTDILEAERHVVIPCGNASDALQLADLHGAFDLLVTDVIMPGMSGRQLSELLVDHGCVSRTLFVSGYAGEALARYGGIQRGERFLQKPFSRRALVSVVEEALVAPQPDHGTDAGHPPE